MNKFLKWMIYFLLCVITTIEIYGIETSTFRKRGRKLRIAIHITGQLARLELQSKIENVISTPHIAGSTYDTYLRVIDSCLKNIKNAFDMPKNIKWKIN